MKQQHKGRKSKNARRCGKSVGFEYWSRRFKPASPGRYSKTLTHRLERRTPIDPEELAELAELHKEAK